MDESIAHKEEEAQLHLLSNDFGETDASHSDKSSLVALKIENLTTNHKEASIQNEVVCNKRDPPNNILAPRSKHASVPLASFTKGVSKNSEHPIFIDLLKDNLLKVRIEKRLEMRQTLNYTDARNSYTLPWYWVPADLEAAKTKNKTKPLYSLKNGSEKLLNFYSPNEDFGKFSLAYETYFDLFDIFNYVWIALAIQTVLAELASYFICKSQENDIFSWILSQSFKCSEDNGKWIRFIKFVIQFWTIILLNIILRNAIIRKFKRRYLELRYNNYSENMFCLLVRNLPKHATIDEIRKYFDTSICTNEYIKVKGMIPIRNNHALISTVDDLKRLARESRAKLGARDSNPDNPRISLEIDPELIKQRITPFSGNIDETKAIPDFSGCAIIYFKTTKMRDAVQLQYERRRRNFFRCWQKAPKLPSFQNNELEIQACPEPEHLVWENLNYSDFGRKMKTIGLTLIIIICLLGYCRLSFEFMIKLISKETFFSRAFVFFGQFIAGFILRIIVKVATIYLHFSSELQAQKFRFNFHLLGDILIFNFSAWTYAFVYDDDKQTGWILLKIFAAMVVANIFYYAYAYVRNLIQNLPKRIRIYRDGSNSLTQKEAEEYYTPLKLEFLRRIISLYLPLTLAMTLYMIYPLIVPICYVAQAIFIKIDKHLLARYYRLASEHEAELALKCYKVLVYIIVLQLGAHILYDTLAHQNYWSQIFGMSDDRHLRPELTLLVFITETVVIPIIPLYYCCCHTTTSQIRRLIEKRDLLNVQEYDKVQPFFETTYCMRSDHLGEKKKF